MDKNVYERTRYQNIYRHKKNKNYVIMISKPVKTSISRIDGKKIFDLETALKVRDNPKLKMQKAVEISCNDTFDSLLEKYIFSCKQEKRLAFNTIKRKEILYNKHLKNKINKKISKITKEYLLVFIDNLDTTDKQKNRIIKELHTFFNWCIEKEYILNSPVQGIKYYKVEKTEMKFWTPDNLKIFLNTLELDLQTDDLESKQKAYLVKIFTLIAFSLGNRVGETRALTWNAFDENHSIVKIKHSINYDRSSDDFVSNTKNYQSQREIEITEKLINEVKNYKHFLINDCMIDINDNDLIFLNHSTKKPYSDTSLRKKFYEYCIKANVPKIRMYDLRHTYVATMMMEGKELYHISRRLGHSNYNTTVNKYGHLSNQVRKEIAEITDKYI